MGKIRDFVGGAVAHKHSKMIIASLGAVAFLVWSYSKSATPPKANSVSGKTETTANMAPLPMVKLNPQTTAALIPPQSLPQQQFYMPPPQYQPPPPASPAVAPADESLLGVSDGSGPQDQAEITASPMPAPIEQEPAKAPVTEKAETENVTITDEVGHSAKLGTTYVLQAGTFICVTLSNRLVGDAAGPVKGFVSYDEYVEKAKVLPQGAAILGEAGQVSQFGQKRLSVVFHSIKYTRKGKIVTVSLDKYLALDQAGAVGLKDKVNNHYGLMIASAVGIGLLSGATLSNTGSALTSGGWDLYRQGIANETAQMGNQVLEKFTNLPPDITIREGTRIVVYIADDIKLPAVDEIGG